jgi:hypothetical protein
LALAVPLSRFTSPVGGGSAFFVRQQAHHTTKHKPMKTNEAQKIEEAKAAFLAAQTKQQTKAAFLGMLTLFVIFIMPRFVPAPFGQVVMAVGAAASFSAYFYMYPQTLRSRSGSLVPAFCLLALIWLCAAVPILLSLFDKH